MGYSPDSNKELVNKELLKTSEQLEICREVKATVESKGWIATIGPIIDRMIMDVLGGKISDTWISGKLDRARSEEKREYYIGYKQALIDLHGRIMFHPTQIKILEEKIKILESEKEERYKVPMVGDTRYRPEGMTDATT